MVDTNSDPREVDYVIPSNDDASKSIDKILSLVTDAVKDGLANRTSEGDIAPETEAEEVVELVAAVEAPAVEATPEVEAVVEVEAAPEAEATEDSSVSEQPQQTETEE
jgi:small subunit ribosomal protein S2